MGFESRNNQPKISVLMPSLNVGPYIRQCLDSVIGQSLQEIEILCIDAGSDDGTLEILQEYEEKDTRIRVILSDRRSYGYQMNLGLGAANGEYIGIVETDDWAEPAMFESLYTAAKENAADIVKANYYWYYTRDEERNEPFENLARCPYDVVFSPENNVHFFEATPAIWSGIYRREMLTKWNIRFNETPGASYQDTSFHFMVSAAAERVCCLNDFFLHYRKDNENSSVNNAGKVYCISDEMHYFEQFLKEHPEKRESLNEDFMALKYEKYRWNYQRIAPQFQWDFLKLIQGEFLQHRDKGFLNQEKFSERAWNNVNHIIDNPVRYYKETCKKYSCRPVGDELPSAKLLKESEFSDPDISIIIPGYNSEKTIERTLKSLQIQTRQTFEIICVDDGSEDATLQIMLDYAKTDNRITVLHQVNEGQGTARNAGIRLARGEYIQFLDSDDVLREDAVEILFGQAKEKDLDILYYDGTAVYESEELKEKHSSFETLYEYDIVMPSILSGVDFLIQSTQDSKYRTSTCLALFRREFIWENGIRFVDGILHEDNPFTLESMIKAKRVWHLSEKLYIRYIHDASTMTSEKTFEHVYGYFISVQRLIETIKTLPYSEILDETSLVRLSAQVRNLRATYDLVENTESAREKFTKTELRLLDYYLLSSPEIVKEKANKEIERISNSRSYKIGRVITWPVRTAKELMKEKNSQLESTV